MTSFSVTSLRSIEECIKVNPARISRLIVFSKKPSPRIEGLVAHARKRKIQIDVNVSATKPSDFELVTAVVENFSYVDFDEVLQKAKTQIQEGKRPRIMVLDCLADPQNLGAIIRTAAFMGISAVVMPKDRAAPITGAVYDVASGGLEYVPICQVTNLVSALKDVKEAGFWVVGFSEHADKNTGDVKCDFPAVIVIGNEEKGIRKLVEENCDYLLQLSGSGGLKSLNASVAAALAMAWSQQQ